MILGRTALSLLVSVSLVACGGGGSSSVAPATGGGGTPAPTPTPTPPATGCSLRAQQDFADTVLNDWYLFPDLLASANPASFNSVQTFLDARVAPARAQGRDQGFTFATSIAEENALVNSGSSAGFGIRLSFDNAAGRLFVAEAYEGASGLAAGLDRGSEITAIGTTGANLQTVSSLIASGGPQAVINALGPADAGVARVLRFVQPGGATFESNIVKSDFSLDPISNRYGTLILNDGGRRIGYLNLRTFIVADAAAQLREAYGQFSAQGVTDLIIDVRYNGGGLVSVAETMGDLMGQGRVGQVFSRTVLRASRAAENTQRNFRAEPNAIAPTRIAFITTEASASASELVINAMLPYLGNNIALIGADTSGKPVGQFAFDLAACDLRVRAVTFQTLNADGRGDYFFGLGPFVPNTCRAGDDITRPFGDPREASTAVALDFLAGRSCTAFGASATAAGTRADSAQGADAAIQAPARKMLQPAQPNRAQQDIPGLF
ncbi:MAG: peptidase S41 [Sphingomonadales bacterium]|nr:peptidase S41 [Sphingomonadales bacterium]NCQ21083.1 peptidase S41 [Sphingomonadales bacterium]NCT03872.1 peptidase S41 [Sphingomonadales bacterium]